MKKQPSDYRALLRAIRWAKFHGYKMPPLEAAVFTQSGSLEGSMRTWAQGLILSVDFAKAMFGSDLLPTGEDTASFQAIRLWAKQVAVEHMGKLYRAQNGQREISVAEFRRPAEFNIVNEDEMAPPTIANVEVVRKQLHDMAGTIPIRTHEISDVTVMGGILAWEHHLRKMVISDNPFQYLQEYMDNPSSKRQRNRYKL